MKTDIQLQQDVIDELKWSPSVKGTQIGVSVTDGVVILNGHVDNYAQKHDAEKIVQRILGVKALAVEIQVNLPSTSKRNDVDIARSIENILEWSNYISDGEHIKVMVENGWVTLTGEVHWAFQRIAAANSVRYLLGVTGVSNQIHIKPQASLSSIKSDIEAAINRQAKLDIDSIKVETKGGSEIILSGVVHSYFERNHLSNLAWRAFGVQNVVNNITVVC